MRMSANHADELLSAPRKPGLFDEEYLRDWTFVVGAGFALIASFDRGRAEGLRSELATDDVVALAINVGLLSLYTFAIFGLVPAAVRRRVRKTRPASPQRTSAKLSTVVGSAMIAGAVGASVGVVIGLASPGGPGAESRASRTSVSSAVPSSSDTVGSSRASDRRNSLETVVTQCDAVGVDRMCFTLAAVDDVSGRISVEFEYLDDRLVDGFRVARLKWTGFINCRTSDARVESLAVWNRSGLPQSLGVESRNAMTRGIETQQLTAMMRRLCS